ncbi:hypothetical protein [Streptomyces sp. DG1A-41]|uniref:hypothetical protein n=1 Tax=Streptomyces sp. DG1A-41 TaxID=3125779 RepID=UPI0030D47570
MRSPVSLEHGARRSRVILVEPALTQLSKLTASETHRLDRAIVAISVNPNLGTEVPAPCCATTSTRSTECG